MLRLALDKPVVVVVGILILSVFGLAAVLRVPIQMIPDMDPRIVSVTTVWPGARTGVANLSLGFSIS